MTSSPRALDGLSDDVASSDASWKPHYWVIAAVPALVLFTTDFLEILFYEHARARNAGPTLHILLLFIFYGAWPIVPRLIWQVVSRHQETQPSPTGNQLILSLSVLGACAVLVHMMVLAVILRYLFSPPGWGPSDYLDSVLELLVQHGGLWGMVFFSFCLLSVYVARRARHSKSYTYEVRHGSRIIPVDLKDVQWVEACGNYAQLHLLEGSYTVRQSLSSIEAAAVELGFIRTHRSALVNLAFAKSILKNSQQANHSVEMQSGGLAPLSRRRLADFRCRLTEATRHMSADR